MNRLLKAALGGNVGSNILTVILGAIMAAEIDFGKAFRGLQFQDNDCAMELAKLIGAIVVGVFGFFVGRKKKAPEPVVTAEQIAGLTAEQIKSGTLSLPKPPSS